MAQLGPRFTGSGPLVGGVGGHPNAHPNAGYSVPGAYTTGHAGPYPPQQPGVAPSHQEHTYENIPRPPIKYPPSMVPSRYTPTDPEAQPGACYSN